MQDEIITTTELNEQDFSLQQNESSSSKLSFLNLSYHLYEEDVALDKLLDICKQDRVAIRDIFISDITQKYLDYVIELTSEERDYDDIADFLVLAATLIELKANSLLPKLDFVDTDEEKTLKKYARVKIVADGEVISDELLADAFEKEKIVLPVDFDDKKNTELKIVYYLPLDVGNEAKNAEAVFELLLTASNE